MRLILVRHGKTVENEKGIIQGHLPGRLSETGKKQAEKLGLRLKDEKIDCIFTSDLKRAVNTAKAIAKHHPDIPLRIIEELRERDHGPLTGKSKDEIKWDNTFWDEGESKETIVARAKKLLDTAYDEFPDGTVIFVGHGGINRALTSVILKVPHEEVDKVSRQRNTSVSIFTLREDENHDIHLLDCVKHLK